MGKIKLTDSAASRAILPDGVTDRIIWDTEVTGFGLRLRPGAKSWVIAYRPAGSGRDGVYRRMKIGTPEILGAAAARAAARIALGRVAGGDDPLKSRREARAKSHTKLVDLLDRYDRDLERRGYVNRATVMSGLRAKMKPLLGQDVTKIVGADMARIMEKLQEGGMAGAAADFRSRARAFFAWAVATARAVDVNPFSTQRKQRSTRVAQVAKAQHGRALSDVELLKVWNASDPATVFGRYVRFLILTGCRRGEAAGLTWAMIDRPAKRITLPASFTKQARAHVIPIANVLDQVIGACHIDARSDYVFASSKSGTKISGWTQLLAKIQHTSGVMFTFHDLRRTFRTGLSRLGVDADIAELALAHARSELENIYNRDGAFNSLQVAFDRWASHVEGLEPTTIGNEKDDLSNDVLSHLSN